MPDAEKSKSVQRMAMRGIAVEVRGSVVAMKEVKSSPKESTPLVDA